MCVYEWVECLLVATVHRVGGEVLDFFHLQKDGAASLPVVFHSLSVLFSALLLDIVSPFMLAPVFTIKIITLIRIIIIIIITACRSSLHTWPTSFVFGSNGFMLTLNNGWNLSGSILLSRRCCCCTLLAKLSFKRFSCPHWSSVPPTTNSHCWRPCYCWHLIQNLRPDFRLWI